MNISIPPETGWLHPAFVDIVSIQSQVIYGKVGNNVAIPTLESFGLKVASVPTVLLSNPSHFPSVHGGVVPIDWLRGYLNDLKRNGALKHLRAVLIGCLGHPDHVLVLVDWINHLRREMKDLLVIIDPVIGDHDVGIYVDVDLIDAYRQHLLPLATGLTPNSYELALLTEMAGHHEENVKDAASRLLGTHTHWVVTTSAAPGDWPNGNIGINVVTKDDSTTINHQKIECNCKGTGDLFAANLIVHLLKGINIHQATALAASYVVKVLEKTRVACCSELILPTNSFLEHFESS
ncbi:pyridoxine/pyridoxal/pyridoxamine kinase [Xenorhabdus sp. 18]|nr:pyridoxine/pyridoxal/pyridoxamine kinase [Xenorhabdus sp. 18]